MEQRNKQRSVAVLKDAISKLRMVECACNMEQRNKQRSVAVLKDAISKL
jgi:hypothetical protein